MKQFKTFKMARYSKQWGTEDAIPMHSSNPEPFDWQELETLTQLNLKRIVSTSPLSYESTQGNSTLRTQLLSQLYPTLVVNNITLTSGAQEGIFLVVNSLLQTGDEVITFTPCFEPLVSVAQEAGAKVNTIALNQNDNWSIPWDTFEAAITENTKLLIINFPHNPTGCCIDQTEFERLVSLCDKHGIWLFSDEVFKGLEHKNQPSLPTAVEHYEKGISMGVMSKSMALPGIRLGWLATRNKALLERWLEIKSHLSICQSSLDVNLTTALLPFTDQIFKRNIEIIENNKQYLERLLHNHTDFKFSLSEGAATTFIKLTDQKAEEFCFELLNKKRIFVMPSPAFMTEMDGFRLTLGKKDAKKHYQNIFDKS